MMADENPTAAEPEGSAQATAPSPETAEAAEAPRAEEARPTAEEVAAVRNDLLRTLAEMENLRRRTEREMADTRQYAVANFAREMLAVGDNLRRAIDAVPRDLRDGGDSALAALIAGVEVTERGLEQSLAKFGVRRIDAKGQRFDPSVHHAMLEIEAAGVPAGTVAEEVEAGFIIGDRVLRPSLVAIAKKTATPPETATDEPGGNAAADPKAASDRDG